MDNFATCPLTATGMPLLYEGEFPTATLYKISLQTHDKKATLNSNGLIIVSTHRIIWIDAGRKRAVAVPLWILGPAPVEDKSSPFRARVLLKVGKGVRVCFEGSTSSKDRDSFTLAVSSGLTRKEWERVAREKQVEQQKEEKKQEGEYVPRALGSSGVKAQVLKQSSEQGATISSGFASIDELKTQAKEMTDIARRFREQGKQMSGEDANELIGMMADLGIETPVTKESTGGNLRVYREELSREISQFLLKPLLRVGGIMTLTDAYLLVMRNRATSELVSPQDFRGAVDSFRKLNVAIEMIRMESGDLAVQLDTKRDDSGEKALQELSVEKGGISAVDVTRIRHIPVQRARAMLEVAEKGGYLVRDETTEGVRFFKNLFHEY